MSENECRGEPYGRHRTKTGIKPMSKNNVGANLVFAQRSTIVCEPMSDSNVSNSFSNIGLIPVFVRRANIRFAPTLVSGIGWISITTI